MRVIKIFRGAPTPAFPNGEPRLKHKLAAQYDTWYPTDCPDGAPILISMPPDVGPALMPQKNWDKFDFIKQNIMADTENRRFFTEQHQTEWADWFARFPRTEPPPAHQCPVWKLPPPRQLTRQDASHLPGRHAEEILPINRQPLQWTGHELREGPLQAQRNARKTPARDVDASMGRGRGRDRGRGGGRGRCRGRGSRGGGRGNRGSRGNGSDNTRSTNQLPCQPVPTLDAWDGDHNDECELCSLGGELVLCYSCNCVSHVDCDPYLRELGYVPEGTWQCVECVLEEERDRNEAASIQDEPFVDAPEETAPGMSDSDSETSLATKRRSKRRHRK